MFFVALLSIVGISCSSHINEKKGGMDSSKFYDDINLFTLSGVNELNEDDLNYPYIEINQSMNNTVLKYHASKEVVHTENYVDKGKEWLSIHFVDEGIDTTYFYKFILNNKIISLRYKGNPEGSLYELMTLSLLDGNYKEVSYSFSEGFKVKPTSNVSELLTNKVIRHGAINYSIVDGVLTVHNNIFDDILKKVIIKEKVCYQIGMHSLFWWEYFGPLVPKVVCN